MGALLWKSDKHKRSVTIKRRLRRDIYFTLGIWNSDDSDSAENNKPVWLLNQNAEDILAYSQDDTIKLAKFFSDWHKGQPLEEFEEEYRNILEKNQVKELFTDKLDTTNDN